MAVEYRALDAPADFERVAELEIDVWGLDPRDAVPPSMLRAIQHGEGLVNGAFLDERLVGMGLMFPVPRGGTWVYWSHMIGVHPDYQQLGIGAGIKLHQRGWALERGGDEIRWTFDPLQRGNANFNLHRLGATFDCYLVNFYGFMTDAINRGIPSDRVEAIWRLHDPRVQAFAGGSTVAAPNSADLPALVTRENSGAPRIVAGADGKTPRYALKLPADLRSLDHDHLLAWRLALRDTLQPAFALGYRAVDFDPNHAAYILHKP